MFFEKRIDTLIEAGWRLLNSHFDELDFLRWRRHAQKCVCDVLGSDHPYAEQFSQLEGHRDKVSVLSGQGILEATKHQAIKKHWAGFAYSSLKASSSRPRMLGKGMQQ